MATKVSIYILCVLVGLCPLVFVDFTNELYEFPKMHFVYLVCAFLFLLIPFYTKVCRKTLSNFWNNSNKLVLVPLLIFFGSMIISTIFSVNLYTSIWGYYSRFNGGIASFLAFTVVVFVASHIKKEKIYLEYALMVSLVFVSVYALYERFIPNLGYIPDPSVRVVSFFGQPNWFAAYCSIILPLVLYKLVHSKVRKEKIIYALLFCLGFSGFWLAYSISGIIGLMCAITLLIIFNFRKVFSKNALILISVFISCAIYALANPGIYRDRIKDVFTSIKVEARTETKITESNPNTNYSPNKFAVSDSGVIRKYLWKSTIELSTSSFKNLLIGTGPETFPYVFQKFRPEQLNYSSEWDYIMNKPHNYYLEVFSEQGLVGVLSYIFLIGAIFFYLPKKYKPMLVALLVTNIFSWPTVCTALIFYIFIGIVLVKKNNNDISPQVSSGIKTKALFILGSIFFIYITSRIFIADVFYTYSMNSFEDSKIDTALKYGQIAQELNANEPAYLRGLSKIHITRFMGTKDEEDRAKSYNYILQSIRLNPINMASTRNAIPIYYYLASQKNEGGEDQKYLDLAKEYMTWISNEFPSDVGVLTTVAKYQRRLGLNKDFELTKARVSILRPDLLEWHEEFVN